MTTALLVEFPYARYALNYLGLGMGEDVEVVGMAYRFGMMGETPGFSHTHWTDDPRYAAVCLHRGMYADVTLGFEMDEETAARFGM